MINKESGITLRTLVIIIIVLLILAGVSITVGTNMINVTKIHLKKGKKNENEWNMFLKYWNMCYLKMSKSMQQIQYSKDQAHVVAGFEVL